MPSGGERAVMCRAATGHNSRDCSAHHSMEGAGRAWTATTMAWLLRGHLAECPPLALQATSCSGCTSRVASLREG